MMIKQLGFLGLLLLAAAGCKNKNNDPCAHDFDQLPLLANVGNNIILPRYEQLENKLSDLATAVQGFVAAPQQSELDTLRLAWQAAYRQWQRAAAFEFGPAEEASLYSNMGLFPVYVARLEDAIATGVYNLADAQYEYARGLPALDYLLNGLDTSDAAIIDKYLTDALASQRRQYLSEVVQEMETKVQAVHQAWKSSGGNYLLGFATTSGVAEGTPMSALVNRINAHYEQIKNLKIGIPVGAKTSYIVAPNKVESYYFREFSLDLALEALDASQDLFLGIGELTSTNGIGLDDYLAATGAEQNSLPLATVINDQYTAAKTALEALAPESLHDALSNNLNGVKAAYAALQNQTIYLKTDMPSVLCVSITYIDNTDDSD